MVQHKAKRPHKTFISLPDDNAQANILVGADKSNLEAIKEAFGADLKRRDKQVEITSHDLKALEQAKEAMDRLSKRMRYNLPVDGITVQEVITRVQNGEKDDMTAAANNNKNNDTKAVAPVAVKPVHIIKTHDKRDIVAATPNHQSLVRSINVNPVTFVMGLAGTGKTYTATAVAVAMLKRKEIDKIYLTRPVVEAGENLGFLPGTLEEKVDPYMQPLYGSLKDILGEQDFGKYMEKGIIQVRPLAYMRGATLDNSVTILDEAQNTTPEQMKMFLTRLGKENGKFIVTGDTRQNDFDKRKQNGLVAAYESLNGKSDQINFVTFTAEDNQRHPLVALMATSMEDWQDAEDKKQADVKTRYLHNSFIANQNAITYPSSAEMVKAGFAVSETEFGKTWVRGGIAKPAMQ